MIENGTLKQKNNRLDEILVKAIFYLNRESQATDCNKKCSKMQKKRHFALQNTVYGADDGIRTRDLRLTKAVRYLLCHISDLSKS